MIDDSRFDQRRALDDMLAELITRYVSTMMCAYIFAAIALLALPQAWHDAFTDGFHPLPFVSWLSQSFLQLVLLSIIMVGQRALSRDSDAQAKEQHDAVIEILADVRDILAKGQG